MNELKNEELTKLRQEYLKIIDDCKILAGDLSDEEINYRQDPGKWSIAECIQHLTVTNSEYHKQALPAIEKGIVKGKLSNDPIKLSFIGKIFMKFEPPPKRKFKNPKIFSPKKDPHKFFDKEQVVKDFITSKMRMIELIEKADGLDMNKVKFSSPVFGLIRVKLGDYFKTMAPHDRRHLWQASQIKNSPEFGNTP
jgi:hypothetical protein